MTNLPQSAGGRKWGGRDSQGNCIVEDKAFDQSQANCHFQVNLSDGEVEISAIELSLIVII